MGARVAGRQSGVLSIFTHPALVSGVQDREEVVLFWAERVAGPTLGEWRAKVAELPQIAALALRALQRRSEYVVTLWTYQAHLRGVPVGTSVSVRDADELLPASNAWAALKADVHICHLADAVRLLGAVHLSRPAIIMDVDTVLLRALPSDPYYLATFAAKASSSLAIRDWSAREVQGTTWGGRALTNWPCKFPGDDESFVAFAREAREQIQSACKIDPWASWMWRLRDIFNSYKLGAYVHPPLSAAPWPNWLPGSGCYSLLSCDPGTKFGVALPSRACIMERSHAVQHWFVSAYSCTSRPPSDALWGTIPDDCLLAMEARLVVGEEWRGVLSRDRDSTATIRHTSPEVGGPDEGAPEPIFNYNEWGYGFEPALPPSSCVWKYLPTDVIPGSLGTSTIPSVVIGVRPAISFLLAVQEKSDHWHNNVALLLDDLQSVLGREDSESVKVILTQRVPPERAEVIERAMKKAERMGLSEDLDTVTRIKYEASINMECPRQPGNIIIGRQPHHVHVISVWHEHPPSTEQSDAMGNDRVVKVKELGQLAGRLQHEPQQLRNALRTSHGVVKAVFAIADTGVGEGKPRFYGASPWELARLVQKQHAFQPSNVTMFNDGKPEWHSEIDDEAKPLRHEQACYAKRKAAAKPRISLGVRNNGQYHEVQGNILGLYSPRTIVQTTFGATLWEGQEEEDGEDDQGVPLGMRDYFGQVLQVLDLEKLAFSLLELLSPRAHNSQVEFRRAAGRVVSVLRYSLANENAPAAERYGHIDHGSSDGFMLLLACTAFSPDQYQSLKASLSKSELQERLRSCSGGEININEAAVTKRHHIGISVTRWNAQLRHGSCAPREMLFHDFDTILKGEPRAASVSCLCSKVMPRLEGGASLSRTINRSHGAGGFVDYLESLESPTTVTSGYWNVDAAVKKLREVGMDAVRARMKTPRAKIVSKITRELIFAANATHPPIVQSGESRELDEGLLDAFEVLFSQQGRNKISWPQILLGYARVNPWMLTDELSREVQRHLDPPKRRRVQEGMGGQEGSPHTSRSGPGSGPVGESRPHRNCRRVKLW